MTDTYRLYRRLTALPFGRTAFSAAFALSAPYFITVRPHVRLMSPHRAEVTIAHRRAVCNHLGTIHAIAVCNGLEAAMGLLAEATVPPHRRWLPKGLEVSYLARSTTDLLCIAETDPTDWADGVSEVHVRVRAVRTDGVTVVEGHIPLHVTDRPRDPAARQGIEGARATSTQVTGLP